MTVGRRNAGRAVAAAVILGLVLFGLLAIYAPDSAAFSPNNYGWDGIEGISSAYNVSFTTSLSSVPAGSVLVIMQPSISFTAADAEAVDTLLRSGGTVVIADNSGVANSLLEGLGSGITIQNQYSINDPLYNWKAKTLPTALVLPGIASRFPFASNVSGIALNQPSPLLLQKGTDVSVAVTSQLSYDIALPGSSEVTKGPFVVAAAEGVGNGTLLVIGDSQFLLNAEWTLANNRALIGNLLAGRGVFIDASHWTDSPLTSSTAQLQAELGQTFGLVSGSPARYVLTLSFVVVALALVPSEGPGQAQPARTEQGPGTFNKEVLERVKRDREKYAGKLE